MKNKKIVEILKQVPWDGTHLDPGAVVELPRTAADKFISRGEAKELIIPENRIFK